MKIYSLITLYHPQKENIDNVFNIAKQVEKVFVIDNSCKDNKNFFNSEENILYQNMQTNSGLSIGFNSILKNFNFEDDDYIIFFDQDTIIHSNFINEFIQCYSFIENSVRIGCLSPIRVDRFSGKPEITNCKSEIQQGYFSVQNVITSSLLTKYKILRDVNFWNENIFLDMADWDFSWRLLRKKYINIITDKVSIKHSIGNGTKKVSFFKIDMCAPIREYYIIRDGYKLLFSNVPPIKKKITLLYVLTFRSLLHILFLSEKKKRLKYMFCGFCDFLMNKKGAIKNK